MPGVVGYKPERLRDAGFRDFMLQDFDAGQIEEFLKLWHRITFSDREEAERKRQRLAKAVADSRPIKLLAGNPLLLTLMAIINRKEELPRNRARLYEKAAELLLQQWDTEAKLLPDFPSLSAEIDLRAKAAILRKVALEMQTAGSKAANLIQGEKLIKLIEEYLREELHFDKARKAANALVDQLRERNFILCWLGDDSYGFVHRTFLEYFCAAEFVDQFEKKRSLDIDGLLALYDQHCREDEWQEVLRLICGQIDESFAGRIIERLTGLVDLEKWDKRTTLTELILAAWCLSEVKNLNKVNEKIGAELLLKVVECFLLERGGVGMVSLKLLAAAEIIGIRWPGKSVFCFQGQLSKMDFMSNYWPEFLAVVFQQRSWIEELCLVEDGSNKRRAFNVLHYNWPDEDTDKLLKKFSYTNGHAAYLYGMSHSLFGVIFWKGFDEYLSPCYPVSGESIQIAAKRAGIPPDKIDEEVRSLSAHMGWDITKGSLAGKV